MFYDRHSIQTAENWKNRSREFAAQADVFVLIIGPNWLTCSDNAGVRRIDDENDPVRHEIEAALGAKSIILPLLHGNAEMPRERDLPSTLAGLHAPNAFRITPDHHDRDVEMLFPKIDALLQAAAAQERIEETAQREKLKRVAASAQRRAESLQQLLQNQGLASPPLSFWRRVLRPYVAVLMLVLATLAFAAGWGTHFGLQPGPDELVSKMEDLEKQVASLESEIAVERKNAKLAQDTAFDTIREARTDRDKARSRVEVVETELAVAKTRAETDRASAKRQLDLALAEIDTMAEKLKQTEAKLTAAETRLRAREKARASVIAAAKAKCDQVAMAPSDPRAGTDDPGVAFDKLDPAGIAICERSVELDPDDSTQMVQLGRLLQRAERDIEAVDWYFKAADQDCAMAQYNLGWMYGNKRGVLDRKANDPLGCKDDGDCDLKAVDWYAKAADQEDAFAQGNLGWMYRNKRGVLKRPTNDQLGCKDDDDCNNKAVDWYFRAAEQGDAFSQNKLGWMYLNKRGVSKRPTNDPLGCKDDDDCNNKAVDWYFRAAEQGDVYALYNLGSMYEHKRGVLNREADDPLGCAGEACDEEALAWYDKATKQGYADAVERAKALREKVNK